MDGGEEVGVATEPDIQLRRLQAIAGQIGAGIIGDKPRTLRAAELLEQGGDVFGIGPGRERPGDAPEMICAIAVQFNGLGAIGDDNPVNVGGAADERGVPPVIHGVRKHLEPRGIGYKDRVHADHAHIDLVAERGAFADAQLPLLFTGVQRDCKLGIGETVFRIRIFGVRQFRRGDAAGRGEGFEGVEQHLDDGGLRGTVGGREQLPGFVREADGHFAGAGGDDMDFRGPAGAQAGEQGIVGRGGGLKIFSRNPEEREQRRGEGEPDGGGFGFHWRRASHTSQPSSRTLPGRMPSSTQRSWDC